MPDVEPLENHKDLNKVDKKKSEDQLETLRPLKIDSNSNHKELNANEK